MGDCRYNLANSLMVGCAKLGLHFTACGPEGYFPDPALIARCEAVAAETGAAGAAGGRVKRRMAELDRLSTSDARALDKAMTEMCALYAEYARSTVALVAFEAYRTLVERTPEDTGRARASWNLGAEPSGAVPPAGDYPGFRGDVSAAVEQAIAKVGADAESFSITSDLDYMPFLEAGWSEQAPAGFIALTFREAAEQLGQMAREA